MNAKNDETKQGHYLTSTDIISLKEVMKWFNIWRAREGSGGPDIDKPRDAFPVFFAGEHTAIQRASMNGAIESGLRVIEELKRAVKV